MNGKTDPAARGGARTATKEQLRVAQATQDGPDEDRSRIQKMIKEIIETTRCSQSQAEIALHDASNNVEAAVNNILESSNLDTWSHYKRKGPKGKEEEEPVKKGGNRPSRRNQRGGEFQPKGGARAGGAENGNDGRENRQPRDNKEDGAGFKGGRGQQSRNRREPGAKRDNKKSNVAENKEEGDDHWLQKNGPLVFNRRENIEEYATATEHAKTVSQPNAAGPLSFADVVRKNAQKPPPPAVPDQQQFKLQVSENKQISGPRADLSGEDGFGLPETSKSPRHHHLDLESSANLLREDSAAGVTFGTQPSPQKLQQSLTDQLKNDLGLGVTTSTAAAFNASPPKKYHESALHQSKAIKAGVVEFMSGEMPVASSAEWHFGFDATPPQIATASDEQHQFRREAAPPKLGGLTSSGINEPAVPRNASTVLSQYAQQQQQNIQPPHLSYGHQQQQFGRNRNGVNAGVAGSNMPIDLRSYGAPSSPPKSQQPLQNLASQQQQTHHPQNTMFPAQLPYHNYSLYNMNMYSPVAPGIRDDLGPILPYQFNQLGFDTQALIPLLANATSAGPLPNQAQHHQNSHPSQQAVQQGLHGQNSHSQNQQQNHPRTDSYSDMPKFQMNIPPVSQQNNSANGHNPQQNSNLGSNQQRQMLDNSSQGSVPPPPGFTPNNMAAPFMPPQRGGMSSMFQPPFQVQAFPQGFPYSVLPGGVQHKSK